MKYRASLFIGRFQPFHNGHLYSLQKALGLGDKVFVGIGSSDQEGTKDNPLGYDTREEMVREVIRREVWDREIHVFGIEDTPSDDDWVESVRDEVSTQLGEVQDWGEIVVVGNNDWTNRILKKVGMSVYESGLYNRDELEGVKIRELIKKGDFSFQDRVPQYLVSFVKRGFHLD